MTHHSSLSDQQFLEQFSNCSLDPELFDHEAHLRLAYLNIQNLGVEKAIEATCSQLSNFTKHIGEFQIYNVTVTIAALRTVDHFIRKTVTTNLTGFIQEFPRLKTNFKDLLAFHYKTDIFNSQKAKKEFLEPELAPFD